LNVVQAIEGNNAVNPLLAHRHDVRCESQGATIEMTKYTVRAVAMRSYCRNSGTWSIWWLDERNPSHLDTPVVGKFDDCIGLFFDDDVLNGKPIKVRFTWSAIPGENPRWEQAFSGDAGVTWETNWKMEFIPMTARP
jgi:hypothetical protein